MSTLASAAPVADLLRRQRAYWATGATRSLDFRLDHGLNYWPVELPISADHFAPNGGDRGG